jgi:hypothetical protein
MRMMAPVKPEWVSISLYAQVYSTNRKTVYKWLEAGLLETFRVGRCIRVLNQPPTDRRQAPRSHDEQLFDQRLIVAFETL